ncbi:hypothetical protein P691DRAFT_779644 [Macrolepiota fuliginosa MF-IS2]|uniref:Uncharacterized protein n=1 Tax=Macrolepiota fuliginosa MF-IS2 TaxID=1400762 RepID=A0A9P5X2W4_9AGAR|nr:hypothetical protein P691DRAFT_779644 [Macrolepiota fuliginosa MF-IS2]
MSRRASPRGFRNPNTALFSLSPKHYPMLSLFKCCLDVPRGKRKQKEGSERGGGDGSVSVSVGLSNKTTTNSDPPAGSLDNAKGDPTPLTESLNDAPGDPNPPARSSANATSSLDLTRAPSIIVVDNANLPNGSFANASNITMHHTTMIDGDNSNERQCTPFHHHLLPEFAHELT